VVVIARRSGCGDVVLNNVVIQRSPAVIPVVYRVVIAVKAVESHEVAIDVTIVVIVNLHGITVAARTIGTVFNTVVVNSNPVIILTPISIMQCG
jgi:hypothetical protein